MIGGALGALVGHAFPEVFPGFWAILGLASVVGGVLRSPLTGIVFTLELTHAWPALLPVIIAAISGYTVSVLALDRSILTEKIARRGLHLTSDYTTDPLETFFVKDVVRQGLPPVPGVGDVTTEATLRHAANVFAETGGGPLVVRGHDGETLGHILIQDILVARLHDLTEATDRSRYLNTFSRNKQPTRSPLRRADSIRRE